MIMPKVGIIMGSDSDLPVMKEAGDILSQMGVAYEMTVCSAHRLPEETARYASQAQQRGLQVIIAGAGGLLICREWSQPIQFCRLLVSL